MTRERAQALIEVVAAVPACIASALLIVDCGVVVRDRIAVAQAAGRAAEARIQGSNELVAARGALPQATRASARIEHDGDRIIVITKSSARLARIAGRPVSLRSSAEVSR